MGHLNKGAFHYNTHDSKGKYAKFSALKGQCKMWILALISAGNVQIKHVIYLIKLESISGGTF